MKQDYIKYLLDKTKQDYSLLAPDFARTRQYAWSESKFLFDSLKSGERVLDLGCGNGRFYSLFAEKGVDYVGVDNCSELIDIAKSNYPDADFRVADGLKLPFEDNSFDKIYSIAVLHHIPSQEYRIKFLKEIKRVLKPEGSLILTVWKLHRLKELSLLFKYTGLKLIGKSKLDFKDIMIPWGNKTERYYHWFSKSDFISLLKKSGFNTKESGVIKNEKRNRQNYYAVAENSL